MKNDVDALRKREGLFFWKFIVVFLFLSISVHSQSDINTIRQTTMCIPGVNKNASFYPVSFKNESERNLYLCVSLSSYLDQPVLYVLIRANDYVKIDLLEGVHYFIFMDMNGKPRGERDGGELLVSSSENLPVVIDGENHEFLKTFRLDIISSDDQVITIDKGDTVKHNTDNSSGEDITRVAIICVIGLVVIFTILGVLENIK